MKTLSDLVAEGACSHNAPLAQLTTYKVGGRARFYAEPETEAALRAVTGAARNAGVAVLTVGRGSNMLISDAGFDGLAVRPSGSFLEIEVAEDGVVTAGSAVPLPRLARASVEQGRGGLEWCVGIPGSVGGAIRMNAGGHGSDTAEVLRVARILDIETGTIEERQPEELALGYRTSNLTSNDVVLRASFATTQQPSDVGSRIIREITQWRKVHQPGGTLNAGSVFKNPPQNSAGRMIDELGLKGYQRGGASVSKRHANFIVADQDTTAQDIYDLVADIRAKVAESTGTLLETEIRFVGRFESTSARRPS